jgi:hypothetical protein
LAARYNNTNKHALALVTNLINGGLIKPDDSAARKVSIDFPTTFSDH